MHLKFCMRLFIAFIGISSKQFGESFATKSLTSRQIRTQRPSISRTILHAGFGKKLAEVEKDPGEVKGTKLKILKYPHPLLRADNEDITVFDDKLKQTAAEMLLLMHASEGIGLAAPQVGINKRLMVFQTTFEKEMVLVNPKIVSQSSETESEEEGCLSFPQINGDVNRSTSIEVEYQTETGEKFLQKFAGLEARVFQHEYDHLQKVN